MLLFDLGVMEGTERTGGVKNKLSLLEKVLWWVKLYGKAMNKSSPWSWFHQHGVATLSLGQGQAVMC